MKLKGIIAISTLLALSVGCTYNGTMQAQPDQPGPGSFYGTYLFIGPCHADFRIPAPETKLQEAEEQKEREERMAVPAIVAPLAAGAAKVGIDWIAAALQRAAQDDVEMTTAIANLTGIDQIVNPEESKNTCLHVVRAQFEYAANKAAGKTNVYSYDFAVVPDQKIAAPLQVVDGTEDLFIEIFPIIRKRAVSFVPLEVRYRGYTPSDRSSKKPRDLGLVVGYALPDQDVSAGEYAGRLINFGTITPAADGQAAVKYVTADNRLALIKHTQWLKLPEMTDGRPVTFVVKVIETRKANQLTRFLAKAFESSREDFKKKAATAIVQLEIFKTPAGGTSQK